MTGPFEDIKEIFTVEAVHKSSENLPLTDTIIDAEAGGELIVPFDIGELVGVHEDDETEKDSTETPAEDFME